MSDYERVDLSDSVTIYRGDCRDVLPTLTGIDAVVTDPPYGIGYQSNRTVSDRFKRIYGDGAVDAAIVQRFPRVSMALFTRWDTLERWRVAMSTVVPVRGCVVWHKPGGGLGDLQRAYAPDYELCLYGSPDSWNIPGKRYGSVWLATCDAASDYQHPTQKPVTIMTMAVSRFSHRTNRILDPFMGSGTTGVACIRTDRKFIGIEIDPGYFAIARQRLENELAQGRLGL